jgi:pyruvate/2-oxoglutarate/acetoin dehydrogenase E1 component
MSMPEASDKSGDASTPLANARLISYAEAVREGLATAMENDPSVFLMGEGIADPASFFGTTKGLLDEFGAARAVEMPIAENGMVGVAIGAALSGQRPVISLHRVEFALLAIEQIVNNAAKSHYVSNGRHKVPLVIRMIVGRGWGQGPEHSQSLESIFGHFPGLKVMMPTMPVDAKGMLIAAIEDDSPVISIEHRWLHYMEGHVPEGHYATPLDGPAILRPGGDATIVATSYMNLEALRAAEVLAGVGCEVELIDLRMVRPLNMAPILESVGRTGRLMTVDSSWAAFGTGAEVCAQVAEHAFSGLKAPPKRLALADHPTPSSRGMVPGFYPDSISIAQAVGEMCGLSSADVSSVVAKLVEMNGDQPIDTPNAYFKGPF